MPPGAAAMSLLDRLDAAAEAGDVDAHQLADALGLTPGGLRAALARPAMLAAEQVPVLAGALGLDAAAVRALRRADGPTFGAAPGPAPTALPPSVAALLDAVVAGVHDDAVGRSLRVTVLDVAAAAARGAGRPLPPAAHELRARVLRAEPVGAEPPCAPPAPAPGDDAALVERAAALVRALQGAAPGYDDLFAPVHDDALAGALRRHAVSVHAAPGAPPTTRFVLTPVLYGRHRLVLAAAATPDQRRLAMRAALAHLLAGHADDGAPLASPAPAPLARLTDVVALADLVPFWQVGDARRRGRLGWRALTAYAAAEASRLTADWGAVRAADRAALRVALWRATGL